MEGTEGRKGSKAFNYFTGREKEQEKEMEKKEKKKEMKG